MKAKTKKDLTPILKVIEAELGKFFEVEERVGMAIALIHPHFKNEVCWITNLRREDGILLFAETADKMVRHTKGESD